jgi:hypothetical protein
MIFIIFLLVSHHPNIFQNFSSYNAIPLVVSRHRSTDSPTMVLYDPPPGSTTPSSCPTTVLLVLQHGPTTVDLSPWKFTSPMPHHLTCVPHIMMTSSYKQIPKFFKKCIFSRRMFKCPRTFRLIPCTKITWKSSHMDQVLQLVP